MADSDIQKQPEQDMTIGPALNLKGLNLRQIHFIGESMARSGMFPDSSDGPKALVKILAGQEIGVTPFQAMTNIHIIQGKATMSANLMAAKLKGSGKYDYSVIELSSDKCTIDTFQLYEGGKKEKIGTFSFSIKDAERAGLVKPNSGWTKYPQSMLFARTISQSVRLYAPDIFNGNVVYSPDEMGAEVDESGDFVKVMSTVSEPVKPETTKEDVKAVEELMTSPSDVPGEDVEKPKAQKSTAENKANHREFQANLLRDKLVENGITTAKAKAEFSQMIIGKDRPTIGEDYTALIYALDNPSKVDDDNREET